MYRFTQYADCAVVAHCETDSHYYQKLKYAKQLPVFVPAAPGFPGPRNIALMVQLIGPSAVWALEHRARRCLGLNKGAVALCLETAPSVLAAALICDDSVKH